MVDNKMVPIEAQKPFETVYELKNEVPSFEEFMKNYELSEKVEILTEAEYQDRVLHGPQYGPGNEQSRTAGKVLGGLALTGLTVVCPPAGLAVGSGIAAGGATVTVVGLANDDEELTVAGLEMMSAGGGAAIGGGSGLNAHSGKSCSLPICPKK